MLIIPRVQSFNSSGGFFNKKNIYHVNLCDDLVDQELFKRCASTFIFNDDSLSDIKYCHKDLRKEEYEIEIKKDEIIIYYSGGASATYATTTLIQILNQDAECGYIHDYPDLSLRGLMLDISRSKVPTYETLKKIVDEMVFLKYNHLELYVEGFSFDYQHFKDEINQKKNYISLDDYLKLQDYCVKHYIDFVPNQNGFGHMSDWLACEKYKNLAECPDGFYIWGAYRDPSTLCPTDEGSIKLVKQMYDDMLPYCSSNYFNMNFDEPFEAGTGRSKEVAEKEGVGNLYLDYFLKLYDYVKSLGKTPMLWGDVILKHPDSINRFPKDAVLIDWGYDHKFDYDGHGKLLKEANVKFAFAPASSTWGSFVGKFIDMTGSIKLACDNAKKHGGMGIILTDWGDIGHLQYLPATYPGLVYAAGNAWSNLELDEIDDGVAKIVNQQKLANIIVELSKFHDLEGPYIGYGCRLFSTILWAEHALRPPNKKELFLERMKSNLIDVKNALDLETFFNKYLNELNEILVNANEEQSLICYELINSLHLMNSLLKINLKLSNYYNGTKVNFDDEFKALDDFSNNHEIVWNKRNNPNGYSESNKRILQLKEIINEINNNFREETK